MHPMEIQVSIVLSGKVRFKLAIRPLEASVGEGGKIPPILKFILERFGEIFF